MSTILNQKITDTHIHLWDLKKKSYDWIENSSNIELKKNYLLNNFMSDVGDLKVNKVVHIQAEINKNLSLMETEWLQSLADNNTLGFPNGIIGFVDLRNYDVEYALEKHMNFKNFRGIRQILKYDLKNKNNEENLLMDNKWINNLRHVEKKKFNL